MNIALEHARVFGHWQRRRNLHRVLDRPADGLIPVAAPNANRQNLSARSLANIDNALEAIGCSRWPHPTALNALLDRKHIRCLGVRLHRLKTAAFRRKFSLPGGFSFRPQALIFLPLAFDFFLAPAFGLLALSLLAGLFRDTRLFGLANSLSLFFLLTPLGLLLFLALCGSFFLGFLDSIQALALYPRVLESFLVLRMHAFLVAGVGVRRRPLRDLRGDDEGVVGNQRG